MIDFESQLNLAHDSREVAETLLEHDGSIACEVSERSVYWIGLRPVSAPEDRFTVRVAWDRYPQAPPSVKFARWIGGGLTDSSAWPLITGYRPGSFDICKPFTKEAYEIHPEWRSGPERWPAEGENVFLWVALILQSDLDTAFEGRSG